MYKKIFAVAVIAAATALAAPFAASAADPVYPFVPEGNIVVSDPTPEVGEEVTVTFTDGSFDATEMVRGTVSADSPATIAIIKTVVTASVDKQASNGRVVFTVTPSAPGSYQVTGTGLSSNVIGSRTLTVVPADTPDGGLPNTGSQIPMLAIWIGAGALALGVALILVMIISRRRSHTS